MTQEMMTLKTMKPDAITEEKTPARCGFVAVLGAPNAGKSTLVNTLVGARVSIVTHKVQTTRARIRGVLVEGATQLVLIDTPGLFAPRRRLDRAMVAAAWEALDGADAVVLLADAAAMAGGRGRAVAETDAAIATLAEKGARPFLVLNKIDQLPRQKLLALVANFNERLDFRETFLVSALNGDGVADLKARLLAEAPEGPWMYPEDQLSDISDRLMAAEITREKLFLRLHEELPYQLTVETTDWRRTAKGEPRIEQTIFVARESHKPIVLGKGGATLKAVGAAARADIAELLGGPAHLFLHVKVRENWAEEAARYREMGLDPVQ